jgi:putative ABC transport system substrate-binding protein
MRRAPRPTRRLIMAGAAAFLAPDIGMGQPVKRHRIAYLSAGSSTGETSNFLKESIKALGYGENELSIESRYAEGINERLADLAAELVRISPEVIVTGSAAAAVAAKRATSSIPIVSVFTADPVGTGLAASLARPGGNVTGLSNMMETIAPQAAGVAVLTHPGNPAHAKELQGARDAAATLRLDSSRSKSILQARLTAPSPR